MDFNELDLAERLLIAHRGTEYFAQRLAELSDDDLKNDTLLPGWSRQHLLAHIGYNANALCRLLDWAVTGMETPMYESMEQRNSEIEAGSTLSPKELRNLFTDSAARLDEKWQKLPQSAWSAEVRTAQGRLVPASETAWMRTREVWIHAVDLGNGGSFADFPDAIPNSLLTDLVTQWRGKGVGEGLVLAVDGRDPVAVNQDSASTATATGSLAAVVRWAAGRGAVDLHLDGIEEPPRWM